MKISNFSRIKKEDFAEEDRQVADRIGGSINPFTQEVYTLTNKNITIADNLYQEIITLEITTSVSNSMIPKVTSRFKNNLRTIIKGISVINVENLTNSSTYPTGAVQVFFSENNNIVTINRVTSLQSDNKYRLTLLTYGG
jgi:hypothetical protein